MAKLLQSTTRIVGVRATTFGMLQGMFFLLIGLVVALAHIFSATMRFTEATQSLLQGMTLGLAAGVLTIVVVPLIYFAIGWVLGVIYGLLLNLVLKNAGGVVIQTESEQTNLT